MALGTPPLLPWAKVEEKVAEMCVCLSARVYLDEGISKLKIMSHDGGRNPALLNSWQAQDEWQLPWKQHPLALPAAFLAQLCLCDPVTTPCSAAPLRDRVRVPRGQALLLFSLFLNQLLGFQKPGHWLAN